VQDSELILEKDKNQSKTKQNEKKEAREQYRNCQEKIFMTAYLFFFNVIQGLCYEILKKK